MDLFVVADTEFQTSYANPDGTTTTHYHSGAIRFRGEDGALRDVDLSIAAATDGSAKARGHRLGLRLAGKKDKATEELVAVSAGKDREVALGWNGKLPAPVLAGTTARYMDLTPGVDMVIDSRRSGFEQTFSIKERPTGAMSWQVPLRTKGLVARAETDGSISFVDASGKDKGTVVSTIVPAIAWDAVVNENTGDHANISPVAMTVEQKGKGKAVLTLTPDVAWLTDPARILPITVDPNYASTTLTPSFDTFVQQGIFSDQSGSADLKIGNNGSGQVARSFLKFPGSIDGWDIVSAELKLYANHAWSCSKRAWEVWDTSSASSSTRWSDQPTWQSRASTDDETKGYSGSCPNGWVDQDITTLVRDDWADGTSSNTIGLRAGNESDAYGWKKFDSSETSNDPYVSITYNRAPGQAAQPSIAPVAAYAPPGGGSSLYTWDTTPTYSSLAGDPDANTVRLTFEVHTSTASTTPVTSCSSAYVPAGTVASCTPGTALANGGTYYVRALSHDGRVWSGAWSPWQSFKVAASTPAAPVVSCPAPHGDGSWAETAPGSNVLCTISATGTGTNAPGYIRYSVDGAPELAVAIAQSADPAVAKITVSVPKTDGAHHVPTRLTKTARETLSVPHVGMPAKR